jgi:hypothetical protein
MNISFTGFILFFVLLLTSYPSIPRESTPYGYWVYVEGKSYKNIHTLNEHNYEFGYVCNNGCMYYITPSVICDTTKVIDGWLIQTSGISKRIRTTCVRHEGETILKINSEKDLTDVLKKNHEVHFLINFDVETNSLLTFKMLGFIDSYNRINHQ